jgi:hypothetical protein
MSRSLLMLLALFSFLAVACAPSVVGSRGNPVDLRRDRSVVTTPGSSVYAQMVFPSGSFGLTADAFADRMAIPIGVDGAGRRATSAFELVDVIAPEGWTWRVDDVWSMVRGGRPPSLEITLRLDVPTDARLGGQQVRGTIVARPTGGREPVAMVVQVVPRR